MEHYNSFFATKKIDERKELLSSESLFLQLIIIAHVIFEVLALQSVMQSCNG